MNEKNNITWEIFWEIPECPPFLTSEPARVFTKGLKEFCGENFDDCILEYRDNTNIWYLDGDRWSKLDKIIFDRMIADVTWAEKINTIAKTYCYPCLEMLDSVRKMDYRKLTDKQLVAEYKKFFEVYIPAHGSGHPANLLEMKNQRLSSYLKDYVRDRIKKTHSSLTPAETFITLIAPIKDMSPRQEAKSLYRLLSFINKDQSLANFFQKVSASDLSVEKLLEKFPLFYRHLLQHEFDWSWTVFNWEGPPNSLESYIESIKNLLRQEAQGVEKIKELEIENEKILKDQESIKRELEIDEKNQKLLSIASDIMFLKAVRKDCMYKGAWASEPMYQEIANRLGLSLHEAHFIFFFEMESSLLNKKVDIARIKERTKEVVLHQRSSGEDTILEGKQATDFINSLKVKKVDQNVSEIKGQVAYPGKATGIVRYVNTPEMMDKMKDGDILLAYVTQPNLLPAMRKAAAFITDFGGITCHAAIVAREWKVPCVIGTGNATKILKDGDLVEMDALNGIVKILKKAK